MLTSGVTALLHQMQPSLIEGARVNVKAMTVGGGTQSNPIMVLSCLLHIFDVLLLENTGPGPLEQVPPTNNII